MKTLSSNAAIAIKRSYVEPILLIDIDCKSPSVRSLHISSRPFNSNNTFNGVVYDPVLVGFGEILSGDLDPISFYSFPGDAQLNIMNNVPIGGYDSAALFFAAYDWAFSDITFKIIQPDAMADGDEIEIFSGSIENIERMTPGEMVLKISGVELTLKGHWPCNILNSTNYSGADPDDLGRMVPQVWGSCKRVEARAIDAGGKTTVIEDLTDSSPGNSGTLNVSDGSFFPSDAFILQVDAEQISIASRSGNVLTLAAADARGYSTTDAAAHDAGAHCAEIKTHYYYMVADHPVKAIDNVYVEGIRQTITNGSNSACRVYYGDPDDSLTGYEGKAMIDFQTLPTFVKQVEVSIEDTLGVDTGDHEHTFTGQSISMRYGSSDLDNCGLTSASNMYDGNESTFATCASFDDDDYIIIYFSETDLGTVSSRRVKITYATWASGDLEVKCGTAAYQSLACDGAGGKITVYKTFTGDSWDLDVRFNYDGAGSPQLYIYEVEIEVTYTPDLGSSAATGVELTGSVTGGGNSSADTVIGSIVSADVQGHLDRSGLFTGSADALIERPDHMFHHMVSQLLWKQKGLIGYWPFSEGSGTVVNDISESNQPGSLEGTPAAFAARAADYALHFDGAADYVDCGDSSLYDFTSEDFSVSFWMYSDDVPASYEFLIGNSDSSDYGWSVYMDDSQWLYFTTSQLGAIQATRTASGSILHETWYHIVIVRSGATATIFVNGVDGTSSHGTHIDPVTSPGNLLIGRYSSAANYYFDGLIDEVRIYNRVLTAAEAKKLYDEGTGNLRDSIDIDGSYSDSGTEYDTESAVLAVALLEPPDPNKLFNEMAFNCKSAHFFEAGVSKLVYMKDAPAADKVVYGHEIELETITIEKTMRAQIRNDLVGLFDKHWDESGTKSFKAEVTAEDATSKGRFGTLSEVIDLPYVIDATTAQLVLDFQKSVLDLPRYVVNFTGIPALLELERGDVISFDADETKLNAATMDLIETTDKFRIIDNPITTEFGKSVRAVQI